MGAQHHQQQMGGQHQQQKMGAQHIRKCKVEEIALSRADSSSKARKSQITTDEKTKRDKEKNYEVTAFGSF